MHRKSEAFCKDIEYEEPIWQSFTLKAGRFKSYEIYQRNYDHSYRLTAIIDDDQIMTFHGSGYSKTLGFSDYYPVLQKDGYSSIEKFNERPKHPMRKYQMSDLTVEEQIEAMRKANEVIPGFENVLRLITEVDPDSARFGEYIWLTRAAKGLETHGLRYEIQNRADVTFEAVAAFVGERSSGYFYGMNYARCLEMHPELQIIEFYCVVERVREAIYIHIFGNPERVSALMEELATAYRVPKTIKVNNLVAFTEQGPMVDTTELIESDQQLSMPCFYPWMDESVESYTQRFMASSASVLLLLGERGTGKSTFLRSMLYAAKVKEASMCCNAETLASPGITPWISSQGRNALVILEDADLLIDKRENGNKQMSAILNLTEGIVKNGLKLVISTNLPSLDKVDSALLRPGRMFDVKKFHQLTVEQAQVVRTVKGMDEVNFGDKKTLTLAEALNYIDDTDMERRKQGGIGFNK